MTNKQEEMDQNSRVVVVNSVVAIYKAWSTMCLLF